MFLEYTVVVTCLYMAWIRGRNRKLNVTHGNVMRNSVTFWLHCVLLWAHLSQVWSGGGVTEMKGGLNYEVAVVSSIDWHHVQHLAVLCFRVLSVIIFGHFCFPIIISGTWGLHFNACHVVPHKEVWMSYERFKIIAEVVKNSSEKQIDI
jgi:hypothetical protein